MKHLAEVLGGFRLSGAMVPDPEIELDEDEAEVSQLKLENKNDVHLIMQSSQTNSRKKAQDF